MDSIPTKSRWQSSTVWTCVLMFISGMVATVSSIFRAAGYEVTANDIASFGSAAITLLKIIDKLAENGFTPVDLITTAASITSAIGAVIAGWRRIAADTLIAR